MSSACVFSANLIISVHSALLNGISAYQFCIAKLQKFIMGYDEYFIRFIMPNPHRQLIDTICNDVLPNMVRIYESKRMDSALDQDQFVKLIEQKIERANKSLKMLSDEEQHIYRAKIDRAYAENIDRLREEIPIQRQYA